LRTEIAGARVADLVCQVARRTAMFTCLDAAVAACWVLRRRGRAPVLCIGTAVEADRFAAHAWVELDGRPVTPPGGHVPIWRSQ
jgi:hypothetical protein